MKAFYKNWFVATVSFSGLICAQPALADLAPTLPSVKILSAPLIDVDAADSYYNVRYSTLDGHTFGLGTGIERQVEIVELARSLGANRLSADKFADVVFEYIHNNIETEFRYGLGKGSLGTVIDQSGTSFDQAHLMFELLRVGGLAVKYQAGTITLNASQFTSWTGVSDARAACRLLADGGIPARITASAGTMDSSCTIGGNAATPAGTVSSVVLSHAWIAANSKLYDPSYKRHVFKNPINLGSVLGCSSGNCGTNAVGTAVPSSSQGFDSGLNASYISDVKAPALGTVLNGYARVIQTYIQNTDRNLQMKDIVGGKEIDLSTRPTPGASLPYTAITVQHEWTTEIPDQYRTRLRVQFDSIDIWLFADEIAGYRLTLNGMLASASAVSSRYSELLLSRPAPGTTTAIALANSHRAGGTEGNDDLVLEVDHPYASLSGSYMDETVIRNPVIANPFPIVNGSSNYNFAPSLIAFQLGNSGPGAVHRATKFNIATPPPGAANNYNCILANSYGSWCTGLRDGSPQNILARWLVQANSSMNTVDGLNQSITQRHHTLGYLTKVNREIAMDVQSAMSINSKTSDMTDRRAAIQSAVAALAALEGGVVEQTFNTWVAGGAIGTFPLANAKGQHFYDVDGTNAATVMSARGYPGDLSSFVQSFTNSAHRAIIPSSPALGSFPMTLGAVGSTAYFFGGLLAYGSDDSSIGYLTTLGNKGGVSVGDPMQNAAKSIEQVKPGVTRKHRFGVDLATGGLSLNVDSDIVTGAGEFPSSLAFQRSYNSADAHPEAGYGWSSGAPLVNDFFPSLDDGREQLNAKMGSGLWKHNFEINATLNNEAFRSLGEFSALDAANSIAALFVLSDISKNASTFQSRLTTIFVADWFAKSSMSNSVLVNNGATTATFIRLPDGQFNPPPGSADLLTQTGAPWNFLSKNGAGTDYLGISFALKLRDGSTINFSGGEVTTTFDAGTFTNNRFKADNWNFPDGRKVDFSYESYGSGSNGVSESRFRLSKVSNNLGRALNFQQTFSRPFGSTEWLFLTVSDETGNRSAKYYANSTYEYPIPPMASFLTKVVTPDNAITKYEYERTPAEGHYPALSGNEAFMPAITGISARINKVYFPTNGNVPGLTITYDGVGRTKSVADIDGIKTDYYPGRISTEDVSRGESVNPIGALTTLYFNKDGNVLQSINALNQVTTNEYYPSGLLKKTIAPEGNATSYTYDVRSNQLTFTQHPKPGSGSPTPTSTTTYNEGPTVTVCANQAKCNKPASIQDAKGHVTSYEYNNAGQLTSITGPAVSNGVSGNAYASYSYTPHTGTDGASLSFLTSTTQKVDGTRNRVASFTYNPSNKLVLWTATTDPSGFNLTTTFTFDAYGNVQTIDGPRPGSADTTTYAFDTMRRLKQVDGPLDQQSVYTYYDDGTLKFADRKEMVNGSPVVRREERTYHPTGDLASVKDPEGNVISFGYDAMGRATLVTDPDGRRIGTVYNLVGETMCTFRGWNSTTPPGPSDCTNWNPASYTSLTSPLRYAAYTYTDNGKHRTVQDANNNETRYQYDGLDRLLYSYFPDPDTGALCSLTSSGVPSCSGRQTYEQYGYDLNDNREYMRTRKGETIANTFDAMNRVLTKTAQGRPVVNYGYNLLGDAISLSDGAHTVSYDYDSAGRKSYETTDGRQVSYLYDETGNRSRTTWADGYYVTYEYDLANRMEYVREYGSTELAHYEYDTLSRRNKLTYAGNSTHRVDFGYEPDGNLSFLNHLNLVNFSYEHNRSGQITRQDATTDFYLTQPSLMTQGYMVNKLNQYVGVGAITGTDAIGNPIVGGAPSSKKWVPIPIDDLSIVIPVKGKPGLTPDASQADPGGDSLVHDLNGNVIRWNGQDGRHLYTYDSENRLRTAAVASSTVAGISYDYDPLGRRLSKTVNGTTTSYLLDGDDEIAEYVNGTLQRRYIAGPGLDDRIAMVDAGNAKSYYHVNHQGSVMAMTDSAGSITGGGVDRYSYDEYGVLLAGNTNGQPFRYTGRRYDVETGLYYYRARYYSPSLGRFLQTDPIGYKDDLNLYAYVGNNPINAMDPTGRASCGNGYVDAMGGYYGPEDSSCAGFSNFNAGNHPVITGSLMAAPAGAIICAAGGCEVLALSYLTLGVRAQLVMGPGGFLVAKEVFMNIASEGGLPATRAVVPGAVNSTTGKVEYLLGMISKASSQYQASLGKAGIFRDLLGFTQQTLGPALLAHFRTYRATGVVQANGNLLVEGLITGPNGRTANIQTIWRFVDGQWQFVTAQPGPRK